MDGRAPGRQTFWRGRVPVADYFFAFFLAAGFFVAAFFAAGFFAAAFFFAGILRPPPSCTRLDAPIIAAGALHSRGACVLPATTGT